MARPSAICPDDVDALVLAAGTGARLRLGPKAFVVMGGRTLLERAVEIVRECARRVLVGVPAEHVEHARRLCGAETVVVPGGATRAETFHHLAGLSRARVVLLHDVVHPFVTVGLSREVVAAAAPSGAAMAARRPPEYVYQQTGPRLNHLTPSDSLWISHKPHAFRRDVLQAVLDAAGAAEVGVTELAARLGHPIEIVASPPWNIKITTREDWRLAGAIEEFHSSALRARTSASSVTRPSRRSPSPPPADRQSPVPGSPGTPGE